MWFNNIKKEYRYIIIIAIIILVIAIFVPRGLISAGVGAHFGNIGGQLELEAFEGNTQEDFNSARSMTTFALFYSPSCGYCKQLMPAWDSMYQRMKNDKYNLRIIKIDCSKNKEMSDKYNITGFPTMIFFNKGMDNTEDKEIYEGERTESALMQYIKERIKM